MAQCLHDMDNSRAAWQTAVDRGMAGALRTAAIAIGWISQMQGRYREGYHLLDSADRRLAQLGAAGSAVAELAPARAEILAYLGYLAIRIGELDRAEAAALECIALLDSHSFALIPGFTKSPYGMLALLAVVRGEFAQAERIALEVTQVSTANGQYWDLPGGYYLWAQAALAQGKLEIARQAAQTSVEFCRQYHQNWFVAYCLIGLGEVCAAQGELAAARTHFQAAYHVRKEYSDPEGMAVTLNHLGDMALRLFLPAEAETHFQAALALYAEISDPGGLATCYKGLGQVAFLCGDLDRTRDCYRQALQTACSVSYTALIMALFTHTGELLLYLGQPEPALAILGFVLYTDQSTYSAKCKVQQVLAEGLNNAAVVSVELPLGGAELLTFDACLALVSSTLEQPLHNAP